MFPLHLIFNFAAFFLVCVTCTAKATAQSDLPAAIMIYLDDDQQVHVESVQTNSISLPSKSPGLVIWAEGDRDRWQTFSGKWTKPSPAQSSEDVHSFDLASVSRSAGFAPTDSNLILRTTLLTQLRVNPVTRDRTRNRALARANFTRLQSRRLPEIPVRTFSP